MTNPTTTVLHEAALSVTRRTKGGQQHDIPTETYWDISARAQLTIDQCYEIIRNEIAFPGADSQHTKLRSRRTFAQGICESDRPIGTGRWQGEPRKTRAEIVFGSYADVCTLAECEAWCNS